MQDRTEPTAFASRGIVFQAVAAGVFVAAVVQITAALAGFGLLDIYAAARGAPVVSTAGAFWIAVVSLAFAIGGFASARLADARRSRDALLCGLLTFSAALIAAVVILTLRPPALVDRSLGPVGNVAATLSMAGSASMPGISPELSALRGEVLAFLDSTDAERGTADRAGQDGGAGEALATILAGIAETADEAAVAAAVSTIEAVAGVTGPVAERRLTEWQRANDRALRDARRSAAAATSAVAAGCFSAFVALFAAMLAAMLGGVLGRPRDSMLEIGAKWS